MKVEILGKNGPKIVDLNRRKGIREMCLNCVGWSCKEVTTCSFLNCPLHPFRSGQGKQNAKARLTAIRNYCLECKDIQSGEVSKCPAVSCPLFPFRKTLTDRSTEIQTLPKKSHIETISENKIEIEY